MRIKFCCRVFFSQWPKTKWRRTGREEKGIMYTSEKVYTFLSLHKKIKAKLCLNYLHSVHRCFKYSSLRQFLIRIIIHIYIYNSEKYIYETKRKMRVESTHKLCILRDIPSLLPPNIKARNILLHFSDDSSNTVCIFFSLCIQYP